MSRKLSILVVIVALLALTGLVMAQGGLPGSGWLSGQTIINVGTAPADIVFTAYDTSGTSYKCGENNNVAPGASVTYLTDGSQCTVPAGFIGSGIVSANQPIAAMVNVANLGTGTASGQYVGTDGADTSTKLVYPLVKNGWVGRTTTLYVQNAGSAPATISVVMVSSKSGGGTYGPKVYNVPASAMAVISPADVGMPSSDFGSATVTTTTGPLAGSMLEHETTAAVAQNLQASKAFSPSNFDQKFFCPLIRNGHTANDFSTGLQVANVSGAPQTIKVSYSYSTNGGATQTKNVTTPSLADGESFNLLSTDATYGIPLHSLGSATVEGTSGQVAALVSDRGWNTSNPIRVSTYSCFPASSATAKANMPLYKEYFLGNTTGFSVQNVSGGGSATVEVTYSASNKSAVVKVKNSTPIPNGASFTFFGVSGSPAGVQTVSGNPADLVGTYGGVVITSNQPIVVQANEGAFAGGGKPASGQDNKNYEGFNQ